MCRSDLVFDKPLNTFVENSVKEIKDQDNISFHYISTKDKPADIASRGAVTSDLLNNKLWWNGPDWLYNQYTIGLSGNLIQKNKTLMSGSVAEYRKTSVVDEAKFIDREVPIGNKSESVKLGTPFGINIAKFSSLTRLLRATVFVEKILSKRK